MVCWTLADITEVAGLEEAVVAYFKRQPKHLPGGIEDNYENSG
jgi:hypothetical protein